MGEIIFSILIGVFLATSGVVMNVVLSREEKRLNAEKSRELSDDK